MATENRRKRARKVFVGFLKRVKSHSNAFKTVDDLYELFKELRALLDEYGKDISPECYQNLQGAMRVTDASREGINATVNTIQFELEHVCKLLPAGGAAGAVVTGVAIVIALVIGGTVVYFNANAVDLVIRNQNCKPIPLTVGISPLLDKALSLVGVNLPNRPVPTNGSQTMTLPPITIEIDATRPGRYVLGIAGIGAPLPIPDRELQSITFDGKPLMGQRIIVDLKSQAQHELVITCR